MARLPAPAVGYEDPTAQAMMDNLKPLQETLKNAKENIAEAPKKQSAHYARRHLHGAKGPEEIEGKTPDEDGKGKGLLKASHENDKGKDPMHAPTKDMFDDDFEDEDRVPEGDKKTSGQSSRKKPAMNKLKVGDFIAIKIHKICRTEGNKKGKLVPKVEGPYLIQEFTDDTQAIAIVADANGLTWKKRAADLSLWEM
ncbi:MAG: hypothetical protein L6R35_007581 [Caloplaca aegaea]|nr:MAG: hypothetical protein L6R35_007581 [Caloplaca aegaea]